MLRVRCTVLHFAAGLVAMDDEPVLSSVPEVVEETFATVGLIQNDVTWNPQNKEIEGGAQLYAILHK